MKKKFKPLLLVMLIAILAVTVLVPVKAHSDSIVVHLPGVISAGPDGGDCACPAIVVVTCGCAIVFQQ